jgi:predicted nuclease of predicted toxin-antitoxin system
LKLLLDTCLSALAKAELQATGHDVVWAGDWAEDPGDETILARAHEERRTLVTLDKDFGELAVLRGSPHRGILRWLAFEPASKAACASASFGSTPPTWKLAQS